MKYIVVTSGQDCGHKHRTPEAAKRCQKHLIGLHRTPLGGQECSAVWYNSDIAETDLTGADTSARIQDHIAACKRDLGVVV